MQQGQCDERLFSGIAKLSTLVNYDTDSIAKDLGKSSSVQTLASVLKAHKNFGVVQLRI